MSFVSESIVLDRKEVNDTLNVGQSMLIVLCGISVQSISQSSVSYHFIT